MPDVTPDWKRETEGGIGRKKPPRGWRSKGRKMATSQEWEAIRAAKIEGKPRRVCRLVAMVSTHEAHHLVGRSALGDDVADNIVPLDRVCHWAVTTRDSGALQALARSLTESERTYIVGKLGEGGMGRLFGV